MQNVIFYFTGTGNSLYISKKLAGILDNTEIFSISNNLNLEDFNNKTFNSVGIVFPVYAWKMPKLVNNFLKQLKHINTSYLYTICNYKNEIGIALDDFHKKLKLQNINLSASFDIKMPGNAVTTYDIDSDDMIKEIISKADIKLEELSVSIKKSTKNSFKKSKISENIFLGLLNKIGMSATPDKKFNINEKCNGCGICKNVCPSGNILIDSKKPIWIKSNCEYCLACINWCPTKAIQFGNKTIKRKRYQNPYINVKEIIINTKKE